MARRNRPLASDVTPVGEIDVTASRNGRVIWTETFRNAVLTTGKQALAKSLAGDIGEAYDFYVCKMLFGTNGQDGGGKPKVVNADRTALFGPVAVAKAVSAVVDPNVRSRVIFTSILLEDDAVGETINELALQMYNGDLYSMATRGGIAKDALTQLTFNWKVNFL